jgi:hypothetical protein
LLAGARPLPERDGGREIARRQHDARTLAVDYGGVLYRCGAASSGLTNIAAREEFSDLTFSYEEEWWSWSWSHGSRLLLSVTAEPRLQDFCKAAFAELHDLQGDKGPITATLHATLIRADRPR